MISQESKVYYVLWKIVGIFPVKIKTKSGSSGIYPALSRGWVVHSLLLATSLAILSLYAVSSDYYGDDYGNSVKMKTETAVVVAFTDAVSLTLATVTVSFGSIMRWKPISELHLSLDISTDNSRGRSMLFRTGFYYLFNIIIFVTDSIVWDDTDEDYFKYIPSYGLHFIVTTFLMQYSNCIGKLYFKFKDLNTRLLESMQPHLAWGEKTERTRDVRPVNVINAPDMDIIKFGRSHWVLSNTIRKINSCYGFQLLTVFLSLFLHIVITPYFLFLAMLFPNDYGSGSLKFLACQTLWVSLYLSQLFIIVIPCASALREANETVNLVNKCLKESLGSDSRKNLESLLQQLVHHSVQFSACGLFEIDLPLITSVTGAVTTYLVILIQFQNSDDQGSTSKA